MKPAQEAERCRTDFADIQDKKNVEITPPVPHRQ